MDTKTSLFVVALCAFVIALGWATSEHGMCDYDFVRSVLADRTKDGAASCFDFWFNRYQTFVAAIIAFSTAVIALRPAFSQLREMQKQTKHKIFEVEQTRWSDVVRAEDAVHAINLKILGVDFALKNILTADTIEHAKYVAEQLLAGQRLLQDEMDASFSKLRMFVDDPENHVLREEFIHGVFNFAMKINELYAPLNLAVGDHPYVDLRSVVTEERNKIQEAIGASAVANVCSAKYLARLRRESSLLRSQIVQMRKTI